jgi:restriction system protein
LSRKNKVLTDYLFAAPWWVSILISVFVFVFLKFIVPHYATGIFAPLGAMESALAPIGAILFLIPGAVSILNSGRKRKMLNNQTSLDSIRQLSWKEFEELLGEAFRRHGYSIKENAESGPDGGIDLTIKRKSRVYLVQCKQYRVFKVDVRVVREMLGLVTAHGAQGAIIATSGVFTREAADFAEGKSIELIDGNKLVKMIRLLQSGSNAPDEQDTTILSSRELGSTPPTVDALQCPRCSGRLVKRVATRGVKAGSAFWGCSNYPHCTYIENLASD